MASNYNGQIFKQLEDVIKKCDNLSQEIKNCKKEHKKEIDRLKEEHRKEVEKLNKRIDELEEENDILKGKSIEKNSSNSNVAPSKDEYKIQNHREKSLKKQGGQKGRKGKTLTIEEVEKLKNNKDVEFIEEHYRNPNSNKTTIKYIMDVKAKVVVRKIYIHGKKEEKMKEIPEKYKNTSTVIYGENIKALVGVMYAQEVIAIDRMSEFIGILSDNKIKVSHGSLCNWVHELSQKCKKSKKKLKKAIKGCKIISTDLTVTSLKGKQAYSRNYSNELVTVFEASRSKRIHEIKKQNILTNFKGYIMHDHDTGLYNFGIRRRHLECWIHLGRELKYFDEYIKNSWSKELWNYAWNINKKRKENKEKNIMQFTSEEIIEYEAKYDEIVKKGFEENQKTKSKYLKAKEKAVLNRLEKYKINYINFIYDFDLPFDDNLSERDLRPIKIKKKISGCHRSFEGLKEYCNIRTIISTCIKQEKSYFEFFKNILNNKPISITKIGLIIMP